MATRIRLAAIRFVAGAAWAVLILFSSTSRAGLWGAEIFDRNFSAFASHHPGIRRYSLQADFIAEKGFHVTVFTVFGAIVWNAFPRRHRTIGNVLAFGAIAGICSELLQAFYPDRDPTIRDALLNFTGTLIGTSLGWTLSQMRRRLREKREAAPAHSTSGV